MTTTRCPLTQRHDRILEDHRSHDLALTDDIVVRELEPLSCHDATVPALRTPRGRGSDRTPTSLPVGSGVAVMRATRAYSPPPLLTAQPARKALI